LLRLKRIAYRETGVVEENKDKLYCIGRMTVGRYKKNLSSNWAKPRVSLKTERKLEIFQSEGVASAGGRKDGREELRPLYKFWAKSVRIFSNAQRQPDKI
jgi:hypothetical protein